MVTRPLVNVALQADRSLELWSLPASGAPRSLGVIAADKASVVQRGKVLEGTDGFAVSLEQAGGSPDGKPHGPILYVGKLSALSCASSSACPTRAALTPVRQRV